MRPHPVGIQIKGKKSASRIGEIEVILSQGTCPYCGHFQNDLEGHCNTYHHMPLPNAVTTPKTSVQPLLQTPVAPAPLNPTPMISTQFCPTCGKKQSAQTWREVVFAFLRYALIAFWVGAFFGGVSGFEIAARVFGH